jgi:hypothetical protein
MLPKPETQTATNTSAPPEVKEREHSSRLAALSNFSLSDMFDGIRDTGSKSAKFPEKLLKVLEAKLKDIAMGKDSTYADHSGSTVMTSD